MKMMSIIPIDNNKIVYSSYRGRYYNDNPRGIYEKLQHNKELKHVWLLNDKNEEYNGIQCPYHSIRAIYELATSAVWVDNCRKETWVSKRKKQIYIQTWHAGISVKKVEADAIENLPNGYELMAIRDSQMTDIYISPAKWCTELYSSAFWYKGFILESGYPRSDILFDYSKHDAVIEEVKTFYGSHGFKLALYAPTFRTDESVECYNIDYLRLIHSLEDSFGGGWKVLVRLHPNIKAKQKHLQYSEKVLDGSRFEDINKLIISCDLFITDYSSCVFDAMELNKRIILYANDIEKYNSERGVYFSLHDMPFPLAQNNTELDEIISNFESINDKSEIERFKNMLGIYRVPNASEIVANKIIEMLSDE